MDTLQSIVQSFIYAMLREIPKKWLKNYLFQCIFQIKSIVATLFYSCCFLTTTNGCHLPFSVINDDVTKRRKGTRKWTDGQFPAILLPAVNKLVRISNFTLKPLKIPIYLLFFLFHILHVIFKEHFLCSH